MLPPLFHTEWLAQHKFLSFTSLSACSRTPLAKPFSSSCIHEDDLATEWKPEPIWMLQRVCNFTLVFNFPIYILFGRTPPTSLSHLPTPSNSQAIPNSQLAQKWSDLFSVKLGQAPILLESLRSSPRKRHLPTLTEERDRITGPTPNPPHLLCLPQHSSHPPTMSTQTPRHLSFVSPKRSICSP